MCGRFDLNKQQQDLERYYLKTGKFDMPIANYNAAPSQLLPVVTANEIKLMRWGLVPQWAQSLNTGYTMINSKAETLLDKRTFKDAFMTKRCLVPATGFYEWVREGKVKLPHRFSLKSRELFSFAGIYLVRMMPEEQELHSFSIITTGPNPIVEPIHNRMPVILGREEEADWLDESANPIDLLPMLDPYEHDEMVVWRVSMDVNSNRNNRPDLIEAVA